MILALPHLGHLQGWAVPGAGLGSPCSCHPASQDEEGAIVMLKRHLRQQRAVEEYGRNIKQLAGRAQGLLAAGHPEGYVHQLGCQAWAPTHQDPFRSRGKAETVFLKKKKKKLRV